MGPSAAIRPTLTTVRTVTMSKSFAFNPPQKEDLRGALWEGGGRTFRRDMEMLRDENDMNVGGGYKQRVAPGIQIQDRDGLNRNVVVD